MSKITWTFSFIVTFLVIGLLLARVSDSAIVGSGNSNINVILGTGSFLSSNCSAGSAFTGVAAGGAFICNPFVFSVSQGMGLLFNPNPLTQSGFISLANATELTIGGINVRNCTGNGHISGFFGNMTPICSINNGNGTVTSVSQAEGIVLNPNPITSTGVVLLDNATNTTLGGIRLANCTGNARFSGFNASLNPICTATASGSGGVVQITTYEGLSSNETPIVSNATLVLNNATELTIGGTRVRNCTSGFHITGYFGNMTPICTGELNNGTVTSVDNAEGIVVNPDPITGSGVVLLANATTGTIGGVRVLNCTGNGHISGYDSSLNPFCSANNGNVSSIDNGSGIVVNPDPIIGVGLVLLANATNISIGGVMAENCTSGFHVSGWNSSLNPICSGDLANGTVTSISEGEGIMANPNPITSVGNILLRNATELLLGGIRVRNCSSTQGITGWLANLTGICSDLGGAGLGIKQLTFGVGVSGNESPLLTNGTIFLKNASSTEIGGILASNCTGTDKLSGVTGGGTLVCTADSGSGTVKQITIYEGLSSNETPITSNATLVLNNASQLLNGGVKIFNCTSGFHVSGWFGNMTPFCSGDLANGTVTSIDNAEGIVVNPDPITGVGVVLLANATTGTIGGVRVLNCTGNGHISGYDSSLNPFCSANNGNGTVTSIASGSGITLNPDPITSTGTIMATNATLTVLGVTKLTNCSTGFYLNGWNATNIPNCVGELNNGSVTSISEGEGIMANPNPIVGIGNILLRNATELLLGGVRVRNCSSTQGITGWLANLTGICSDLAGNGNGIKQLTYFAPLSSNETIIYNNATLMVNNATSTSEGVVRVANCTSGQFVKGWNGLTTPSCDLPYQNPYCNPLINESCTFYDFNGFPNSHTVLTQFFDAASHGTCFNSMQREWEQYGFGACNPAGFISLPITNTVNAVANLFFKSWVSGSGIAGGCTAANDISYNCSRVINNSNIIEMSMRFSKNSNLTASLSSNDNVTILFGFIMRNNTAVATQAAWLPNNFENMIAFYHYTNMSNWTAITMSGGNASNQTTELPLDFNLTGGFFNMNTFKIVRENSTGNMLFYFNASLVANHSSFIPTFTTHSGIIMLRHNTTNAQDNKFLLVDYMKYYVAKSNLSVLQEVYP